VRDGPLCAVFFSSPFVYPFIELLNLSAADFNCRLPVNTSPAKIFVLTFVGVLLPVIFMVVLGALLMTVPTYAAAYETGDAAGVLMKGASVITD
jgi:purine-cytosine permease-like protein